MDIASSDDPSRPGGAAPNAEEDRIRRALRDAAVTVDPHPWPAQAVMRRAVRRRRSRLLALALPVVGTVVAIGGVLVAGGRGGPVTATAGAPAGTAASSVSSAPSATPTSSPSPVVTGPPVRVVPSGQPFAIGDGMRMKLEPGFRCIDANDGGGWFCRDVSNKDGNQSPGSVSLQTQEDRHGTSYTPLYIGPDVPDRMSLTADGHTWSAQVVTLAGRPGWATGYVDVPTPAGTPAGVTQVTVTVWDAEGRVIASLEPPDGLVSSQ